MKRTTTEAGPKEKPARGRRTNPHRQLVENSRHNLFLEHHRDVWGKIAVQCCTRDAIYMVTCCQALLPLYNIVMSEKNAEVLQVAGIIGKQFLEYHVGEQDAKMWLRDGGLVAGEFLTDLVMAAMRQVDRGEDVTRRMLTSSPTASCDMWYLCPLDHIELVLPQSSLPENFEKVAEGKEALLKDFTTPYHTAENLVAKYVQSRNGNNRICTQAHIVALKKKCQLRIRCTWIEQGGWPVGWVRDTGNISCRCFFMGSDFVVRNMHHREVGRMRRHHTKILQTNVELKDIKKLERLGFKRFLHPEMPSTMFSLLEEPSVIN